MAVAAIAALASRRGAKRAREIMQILADAECAPITALQIKAVDHLMTEPEYAGTFDPGDLATIIRKLGAEALDEAKIFQVSHRVQGWRALAVIWFKKVRRGSRKAA